MDGDAIFGGVVGTVQRAVANWFPPTFKTTISFSLKSTTIVYSDKYNFGATLVTKVELPDQRTYQFYYNPYGEVARIILPTGGGYDY